MYVLCMYVCAYIYIYIYLSYISVHVRTCSCIKLLVYPACIASTTSNPESVTIAMKLVQCSAALTYSICYEYNKERPLWLVTSIHAQLKCILLAVICAGQTWRIRFVSACIFIGIVYYRGNKEMIWYVNEEDRT
jgi:hypothetical protein